MGIAEMKPFDLEAAKRGDPVWVRSSVNDPWYKHAWFIGVTQTGRPILEWPDGDARSINDVDIRLCMAPKRRTVWINVYESSLRNAESEGTHAAAFFTEEGARHNAKFDGAGVLAAAIPIEIEV